MKKTIFTGLFAGILALAMVASISTSNLVTAEKPDNPNLAGKEASQLAQCDEDCLGEDDTNKGGMGQHASDEHSGGEQSSEGGRAGLANALTEHGDPQHPSEVIGDPQLCGPTGSGCP